MFPQVLAKPIWYLDRKGEMPAGKLPFFMIPIINYHEAGAGKGLAGGQEVAITTARRAKASVGGSTDAYYVPNCAANVTVPPRATSLSTSTTPTTSWPRGTQRCLA